MSKFKSSKLQRLGMMGDDGVAYRNKGCKDAWSPADPVKGDDGLYVSVGNNMCLLQSTFTNIEAGGSVGVAFLGLLPGACVLSRWVFFGVTFSSLCAPKVVLGMLLDASKIIFFDCLGLIENYIFIIFLDALKILFSFFS